MITCETLEKALGSDLEFDIAEAVPAMEGNVFPPGQVGRLYGRAPDAPPPTFIAEPVLPLACHPCCKNFLQCSSEMIS